MRPNVLVLGANGFIGREVVSMVHASGQAAAIAGVRRMRGQESAAIEHREVDATDPESVFAALRGISFVVNCVAGNAATIERSASALCAASQRMTPAPLIVHLSSMAVYGSATGVICEAAPLRGDLGPYSAAKVAAEKVLAAIPGAVILRPGCVIGRDSSQWTLRIARLLRAKRLGDLGAAGDGFCNVVHVSDVARAVGRIVSGPGGISGAFNLAVSDAPTWNEFLVRSARAFRAVPVRRISGRRLRVESRLLAPPLKVLEIAARALHLRGISLPPPIPPSLLRLMAQEIRLDVSRAESILGMRWMNLDDALMQTTGP